MFLHQNESVVQFVIFLKEKHIFFLLLNSVISINNINWHYDNKSFIQINNK